MRVAIVVQRYGEEVVGGAETLSRQIAEKLATEFPWEIHVITTTARDYQTWKNHYQEGWSLINNVKVLRFNSLWGRSRFFRYLNRLLASRIVRLSKTKILIPLAIMLEIFWLLLQGPFNYKLAFYIKKNLNQYDRFIFFTYLYLPTIWGIFLAGEKSILVPAAHDEKSFHFLTVKQVLKKAAIIFANSVPEKELIASKGIPKAKIRVVGTGIDGIDIPEVGGSLSGDVQENEVLNRTPFVLYLGRLSRGKQVDQLIRWFVEFHERTEIRDVKLFLAGQLEEDLILPESPFVQHLGFLPDDEKRTYVAGAVCVINPSALESLSLIVIEAMILGRPVLVNAESSTMEYYVNETDTVFGYSGKKDFFVKLAYILKQDWQDASHVRDLEKTRRWVMDHYSWDRVLNEYKEAVTATLP